MSGTLKWQDTKYPPDSDVWAEWLHISSPLDWVRLYNRMQCTESLTCLLVLCYGDPCKPKRCFLPVSPPPPSWLSCCCSTLSPWRQWGIWDHAKLSAAVHAGLPHTGLKCASPCASQLMINRHCNSTFWPRRRLQSFQLLTAIQLFTVAPPIYLHVISRFSVLTTHTTCC